MSTLGGVDFRGFENRGSLGAQLISPTSGEYKRVENSAGWQVSSVGAIGASECDDEQGQTVVEAAAVAF